MAGSEKTNYGIDAPGVIRNFILIGIAGVVGGVALHGTAVGPTLIASGAWCVIGSGLMVLYAWRGKFRHRDRMLGMIEWTGREQVLDVGTGRGLLMIGAAHKLSTGKAVGIDVWNAEDLSGNRPENAARNAELEGVAARIELRSEDARTLSFADRSFDVVLSNLCLHNLYDREQRAQACREIARVLKPGGKALISDFRHTAEYAASFKAAGLQVTRGLPRLLDTYPPLRVVTATREG